MTFKILHQIHTDKTCQREVQKITFLLRFTEKSFQYIDVYKNFFRSTILRVQEKPYNIRMHSSRMRAVRFSGRLWGGGAVCLGGGVCPRGCLSSGGVCLGRGCLSGGCTPPGPEEDTPLGPEADTSRPVHAGIHPPTVDRILAVYCCGR